MSQSYNYVYPNLSLINRNKSIVKCRLNLSIDKKNETPIKIKPIRIKQKLLNASVDFSMNKTKIATDKIIEISNHISYNDIPIPKNKITTNIQKYLKHKNNFKSKECNKSQDYSDNQKFRRKIHIINVNDNKYLNDISFCYDANKITNINSNKYTNIESKDSFSTTDSKRKTTPKLLTNHPSIKKIFI